MLPSRVASRDPVVQYELNEINEPEHNRHATLESRLRRDWQPHFRPTGWSDEIIEEVEQLNERLAANG